MFPDMYFQYNHPTIKSQQKPFDKNRQYPLHPPHHQSHTPPQRIQRSADATPPPGTSQGNSAPAAIQRSADGPPPPGKPPHLTPQKPERTDCQRDGCMVGTRCVGLLCGHKPQSKPHLSEPGTHQRTWRVMGRPARQKTQTLSMTRRNDRTRHDHAAAPLADCPFVPPSIHPTKKEPPGPNTRELSPKRKTQISNYHQSLPVVTNHHPTRSRNF